MAKLAASSISKQMKRERVSGETPVLSPTEDNFFYCENDKKQSYIGASFISGTLNGMDDQGFKLFVGAISVKLPANSIIQITQLATNHVLEPIEDYNQSHILTIKNNKNITEDVKKDLFETLKARVNGLRDATRVSPIENSDVTLRDNRLIISVKVPADLKLSEYDLERVKEQILSVYDGLKNSVLYDIRQLTKEEYIAQVRSFLYPFLPYDFIYDDYQKVSEQVFQKTTEISNKDPNCVKIDDSYFSVLSVKALPKTNTIGLMNRLVGDPMGSHRQVSCPFMINCTIIIPDTQAENNAIEFNYMQTQDTATPFAKKMSPKLRDRLDGLELMFNETKRGEIPCKLYFNVILFNKDKNKLNRVSSMLQNYYKTDGLTLVPDTKIVYPLLWNAIPLYPSIESLKNTHRVLTMTIQQACTFAPLFSDFQNYKTNYSQVYYTRRGNLYGFDPMRGQNHNGMIFGSSGGGKSVACQNFIQQEFESGAMIRLIDEGRSYEKLCATLGGTYIEFNEKSDICLNPFTLVKDIHEELDQIVNIVKQMASPTTPLSDYQSASIKAAITSAFNSGAQKTTITDVAEFLGKQEEPEIWKLARQLHPYTDRGQYGSYFNGDNNLNLNAQMIVLELQGLKQNDELKTVVMMLLLSRIQSDMYYNQEYKRKFVFFEEVTSYLNKAVVAQYISDFYERLRKYGAGVWLITQNLENVAKSESIGKILLNANYIMYLPYKSQEIDNLVAKGYVNDDPYVVESFKSLRLAKGQYSEALIFETDTSNTSVVRIVLNEYERILFSSTGDYFHPFLARMQNGEKVKDIVSDILIREKEGKSHKGSVKDRDVQDALARIQQGEDIEKVLIDIKRSSVNSVRMS